MKYIIRDEMKMKRSELSKEYVKQKSYIVYEKFIESTLYKKSNIIMSYVSIKNEVDTFILNKKILMDNKRLLIPCIYEATYKIIPHEVKLIDECTNWLETKVCREECKMKVEDIDLVIVPALAYDKNGNRIGFGKGYYDRFLENYKGIKVGFAYDFQVVDEIIKEKHDVKVDYIFTS